ncbi:MAG: OmpA family protein [Deltaproteobacteria bacterium]|nr:OmpA family protein [Deltaproteobacteria bacterium]
MVAFSFSSCGINKEVHQKALADLTKAKDADIKKERERAGTCGKDRDACEKTRDALDKKLKGLTARASEIDEQNRACDDDRVKLKQQVAALDAKLVAQTDKLNEAHVGTAKLKERESELAEALAKERATHDNLLKSLKAEIDAGKIEVVNLRGVLTVKLKDKILFDSGKVKLKSEGQEALKKLAEVLTTVKDKQFQVQGHTDNIKIRGNVKWPTNWELSAARAAAVVRFLAENGVEPQNLSAAGLAEFQPVAANDTEDGRRENRRIEIILVPRVATLINK